MQQLTELVAPGELLGERYRVLRMLGSGATGVVVLAEDTLASDVQIALKLLYPHLVLDSSSFGRFRAESIVTMKLAHPNVLPTYGIGYDIRRIYFHKLLYNSGFSFRELLQRREWKERTADERAEVLLEVAYGLAYAHECGVIHRDIKPENVLISSQGEVRVSDFGLSQLVRQEARLTGNNQLLGTPNYMSPEQIRGEALDPRSDVYSFGVMAYEVLANALPFSADSFFELAELHLYVKFPSLKDAGVEVPDWLNELLRRCGEKSREYRPESMQEVARLIEVGLGFTEPEEKKSSESALYVPISGTQRSFGARERKRWHRRVRQFTYLCVISFVVLMPSFNTVHWRLNGIVLWLEKEIGVELATIRRIYALPVRWENRYAFFDSYSSKYAQWDGQILLYAGLDPNIIEPFTGRRALHEMIRKGIMSGARNLILAGADVNLPDSQGRSSLIYAIVEKRLEFVEPLLDAGADVSQQDALGNSPLHYAVAQGAMLTIAKLLTAGANPHLKNHIQVTPLEDACRRRESGVLVTLEEFSLQCFAELRE